MPRLKPTDIRRLVPEDVQPHPGNAMLPVLECHGPQSFHVGTKGTDMYKLLGDLRDPGTKYVLSNGDWSLHELVRYVYHFTGQASLALTSWGLTERPLEQILELISEGLATEPVFLLDYRVKLQSAAAYQLLLASGLNIRLTQNHSKLCVVLNERFGVTICSSANLTRNPRLEFYVVNTSRHIAEGMRNAITALHAQATPLT